MRFRYKILMINIGFLSLILGAVGFLMIYRTFRQSAQIESDYAIEENSLLQSSIEYQLLGRLEIPSHVSRELFDAATNTGNMLMTDTTLAVFYDGAAIYCNKEESPSIPQSLADSLNLGDKGYVTEKEGDSYKLYVSSKNTIYNKDLYIVTVRDVSNTYHMLYRQIRYFFVVIGFVLLLCGIFFYFISARLTKPLEQLNTVTDTVAGGDYSAYADISSDDEIGMLADKFNHMTLSISEKMDELNRMVHQREQFVADFTHEIKTPMTAIIGYADTLRTKPLAPENQQIAYDYIYSEGKRLEALSLKLFDLIYLSQNELQKSEIDTAVFGQEITESVTPILRQKQITLITEIKKAALFCEPELLKTVFINLIDNAKKASSPDSTIYFTGYPDSDSYVFQVRDEGCGMDEETISHICDEFYMADKSRSRAEGGAGLGMSLAALIIDKHDGKLSIESELGVGTTMTVALPASYSYQPSP